MSGDLPMKHTFSVDTLTTEYTGGIIYETKVV